MKFSYAVLFFSLLFCFTARSQGNPAKTNYNTINTAPCINEDFESTPVGLYAGASNSAAITGWTLSSCSQSNAMCIVNSFTPGSPEAWVVNTPVLTVPGFGTLPASPLGGSKVIQLNDISGTGLRTKLSQTIPVTSANALFQFAYAFILQDGGHVCCMQPFFSINVYDCNGNPLSCYSVSFNATGVNCFSTPFSYTITSGLCWSNWQMKYFDLSPYIGSCVTVDIVSSDCTSTGHYGYAFFDARCGGAASGNPVFTNSTVVSSPVSICPGASQVVLNAPPGYAAYQWVSPLTGIVPAGQGGTSPSLTITNPTAGVYTVNLIPASGCRSVSAATLTHVPAAIINISNTQACPGINNGSATITMGTAPGGPTGNNSFTIASTGSITPSYSVAIGPGTGLSYTAANLAAGVYTIMASNGLCPQSTGFQILLAATPFSISLTPQASTICAGESVTPVITLTTSSSQPYTYSWVPNAFVSNNGFPNAFITPVSVPGSTASFVYTVIVTPTGVNCPQTQTLSIFLKTPPATSIAAISPLCANAPDYTIAVNPPGGNFYNIPGTNTPVHPTSGILTPSLAGTGTNTFVYVYTANSCTAASTGTYIIKAIPLLSITANTLICKGDTAHMNVSGADIYTWTPVVFLGGTGVVASPAVTTIYTVTGASFQSNCSVMQSITVTVSECTGINDLQQDNKTKVYPNPFSNELIIDTGEPLTIIIYDVIGKMILEKYLPPGEHNIDMSLYSSGVYMLKATGKDNTRIIKVVKRE